MALPTGVIYPYGQSFMPYGGNLYLVAYTSGPATARVYKAASPDGTWTEQDSTHRPTVTLDGGSPSASTVSQRVYFDGAVIHISLWANMPGEYKAFYAAFDCATDSWLEVGGTGDYDQLIWGTDLGISSDVYLIARDDSDVVALGVASTERVMGTNYNRVYYAIRESGTGAWGTPQILSGTGHTLSDSAGGNYRISGSNAAIFFYLSNGTAYARKLSSADSLGSAVAESDQPPAWRGSDVEHSSTVTIHPQGYSSANGQFLEVTDTAAAWYVQDTSLTGGFFSGGGAIPDGSGKLIYVYRTFESINADLRWGTYDPSDHSWTNGDELIANSLPQNSHTFMWRDGSTIWYTWNSNSSTIEVGSFSISADPTIDAAISNAGQSPAGDAEVAVEGDGAVQNAGQSASGNADVSVQASGAIQNAGQAVVGDVIHAALQVSGAVSNAGQSASGSASVEAQLSGSVTNVAQAASADADARVSASAALQNAPQTPAGSASAVQTRQVSAALANAVQTPSGSAEVAVALSGAVTNAGQAPSASVDVSVELSGGIANAPQAVAISAARVALASAAIANASQAVAADADAIASVSAPLQNAGQSASGSVSVGIEASGSASNAGQAASASASVASELSGSASNAPQAVAISAARVALASAAIQNAPQSVAGDLEQVHVLDVALSNAPQGLSGSSAVAVELSAGIQNELQPAAASVDVAIGGSGSLSNAGQGADADADLIATASGGVANRPQNPVGFLYHPTAGSGSLFVVATGDAVNILETWSVYTAGDWAVIDEGITAADGTEVGDDTNVTGDYFLPVQITDWPEGWQSQTDLFINARFRVLGAQTNNRSLYVKLVTDEATPVDLTNEILLGSNITNTAHANTGELALTLQGSPTKAQLDNAVALFRLSVTKNKGGDTNGLRLDTFEVTGDFVTSGGDGRQSIGIVENERQSVAGSATPSEGRSVSGSITNAGQDTTADVFAAVSASSAVQNATQAVSGDADAAVSVDAAVQNAPQAATGSVELASTQVSGAVQNAPQQAAADVSVPVAAQGGAANAVQTASGDADVAVTASAAPQNAAQSLASTVVVAQELSGAIDNAPQAVSGSVGQITTVSAAIANAPQAPSADAEVSVAASGSVGNAPQSAAADVAVANTLLGSLQNAGQAASADSDAVASAQGDVQNAPQQASGSASTWRSVSGDVQNAPQAASGAIGNVTGVSGAVSNAAQDPAASAEVVVTTTTYIVNRGQGVSGDADNLVSASSGLSNGGQQADGDTIVIVTVTAGVSNAPQDPRILFVPTRQAEGALVNPGQVPAGYAIAHRTITKIALDADSLLETTLEASALLDIHVVAESLMEAGLDVSSLLDTHLDADSLQDVSLEARH